MKRLTKFLIFTAFLVFCLCNTVFAATTVIRPKDPSASLKSQYDDMKASHYDLVSRSTNSAYVTPIQPIDALPLNSAITLSQPVKGYEGDYTIWSLPMLKGGYYYSLVSTANPLLEIPDYAYPVLVAKREITSTESTSLYIYKKSTDRSIDDTVVATIMITVPASLNIVPVPNDYQMDDSLLIDLAESTAEGSLSNMFPFSYNRYYYPYCTKYAVFLNNKVIARNDSTIVTPALNFHEYTELYGGANIFMSYHTGTSGSSYAIDSRTFPNMLAIDQSVTTSYWLAEMYPNYDADKAQVYAISYKDNLASSNNHSRGYVSMQGNQNIVNKDVDLAYAIYFEDKCFLVKVDTVGTTVNDAIPNTTIYPDSKDLDLNESLNLYEEFDGWVFPLVVDNPNSPAASETSRWTEEESSNGPILTLNEQLSYEHNVVASTLWGGFNPHIGAFRYSGIPTYDLHFDSKGGTSCADMTIQSKQATAPTLPTPERAGYIFEGWYTDVDCLTPYNYFVFQFTAGSEYTLYAKWTLHVGNYTVTFYNDKTTSVISTDTFQTTQQPTLPSNPTYTGYQFKNWLIVDSMASDHGDVYDTSTFKPEIDGSYIFKTNWDTKGIIKSVTPVQTNFYVNQTLPASNFTTVVQTDSDGTTKTCTSSEISISPTTVTTTGTINVTVTYKATGATYVCQITALEDTLQSIKASYSGGSLTVGTAVPTAKIKVTGTYASGTTKNITSFSISPSTITAVGSNTVTVTASGYTTTIKITGLSSSSNNSNSNKNNNSSSSKKTIKTITASYVGKVLHVGDAIDSDDFIVRAYYTDGTTKTVNSGDYSISPTSATRSGTMNITISYSGYSANVSLNILAKEGDTNPSTVRDLSGRTSTSRNSSGSRATYSTTGTRTNASSTSSLPPGSTVINGSVFDEQGNYIGEESNFTTSTPTTSSTGKKNDKVTSIGYLNGNNVTSDFMNLSSGSYSGGSSGYNTKDITAEIDALTGSEGTYVLTLINGQQGNTVTSDNLQTLKSLGLKFIIKMMDPDNTSNEIGEWDINLDATTTFMDFDPNIWVNKFKRSSDEVCVGVTTDNPIVPSYATLFVNMQPYLILSEQFKVYAIDNHYLNQGPIATATYTNEMLSMPNREVQGWAITTDIQNEYDYAWDMSQEPNFGYASMSEDIEEGSLDTDAFDEEAVSDIDVEDPEPIEPPVKSNKNILLMILGAIIALAIIGTAVYFLILRKPRPQVNPVQVNNDTWNESENDMDDDEVIYPEPEEEEPYDDEFSEDEEPEGEEPEGEDRITD